MGNPVFVKDFPIGKNWLAGTVSAVKGPLSYHVTLTDGRVVRRHVDHVRIRTSSKTESEPEANDFTDFPSPALEMPEAIAGVPEPTPELRRSTREVPPIDRYNPTW